MKCYNHPDHDAVGSCKNCSKGICHDCITLVDGSVACTATCIEEVRSVNELVNRGKRSRGLVTSTYYRTGVFLLLMAALFLYLGLITNKLSFFLLTAGGIFALCGLVYIYTGYKYKK